MGFTRCERRTPGSPKREEFVLRHRQRRVRNWNLEALGHLGVVAARLGEQDDAQRISQRLAVWEYPYLHGRHTYWRASIAAALGDRDDAVRLLRQAFAEGLWFVGTFEDMRHGDMNLDPLRGYPPFVRLMAPKERSNSK